MPEWFWMLMCMGIFVGLPITIRVLDWYAKRLERDGRKVGFRILIEPRVVLGQATVVAVIGFCVAFLGWFWLMQVPYSLAVGWVLYLNRVERQIEPDAAVVGSAVVCLAGVAFGSHLFLRWMASTAARPWPVKRTLQLLLLLVMMFVVGVAFTGLVQQTTWLIRTPEPLLKDARRLS